MRKYKEGDKVKILSITDNTASLGAPDETIGKRGVVIEIKAESVAIEFVSFDELVDSEYWYYDRSDIELDRICLTPLYKAMND